MALTTGTGLLLSRTTALPSATSFTMAVWARITSFAADAGILGLGDNGTGTAWKNAGIGKPNWDSYFYVTSDGGAASITGLTPSINTWYFFALSVAASGANNLKGYIGSASSGALATASGTADSFTPSGMVVGKDLYWNVASPGQVAAIKIWDAALTADELELERRFFAPVRLANLHLWCPCVDDTVANNKIDLSGNGKDFTQTGTPTIADGPPIRWARKVSIWMPADAGGATSVNVNLTGVSATGNKTAPTSTGTANVSPSGIQATGGQTAPVAQAVTRANATGIAATGEQTAPATQGTANVTLVGQPATGAIGSVTASTPSSATVDLAGIAASGERGTPEATATARHTLAGIAASGDKGTLAAAGTGSVALAGVGSAADIGDPSAALQTRAALDGIPATGEAADVGNEILTNAALSGRQGAAAVGACTVTITSANQTFVDVVGLAATGGIGDLATSGTATVSAWGIESVGAFGEIYWPLTQTQTGGRRRRKGGGGYIAPPKPEKPKVYVGGTVESVNAFTLGLAWAESTSEGVLVAPPALVAGRGFTETGFDGSVFAGKPQVMAAAIVIPQQNDDAELILMGIL